MDQVEPTTAQSRSTTSGLAERRALIPIEAPRRERGSLWKRISARRSVRRAQLLNDASSQDALLQRLDAIEAQLRSVEGAVELSATRLETRFLQFWEMEEQLGKLTTKLSELEMSQRDAAERTRVLSRRVALLAVFALIAAGAALTLSIPLGI